jgi:hypothetical protein
VKDPRLCHVVRIWLDIIVQEPAMGIRFIRLHRNPRKVAKSMTRCYGFPHEEAMRVIRERADLLDRDLEGQTVLDIQFPDIVSGTAWAIIKDWL